jgi:hypothetical protein
MTLIIEIPAETEHRLKTEAARLGIDAAKYASQLIEQGLQPPPAIDHATLDLLAQWDREDETDDPSEIARRNQDFEELKLALNQNRLASGGPNARKREFPAEPACGGQQKTPSFADGVR